MFPHEYSEKSQRLQAFFQTLPAHLSRSSGFVQRQSKLTAERFLQLFVLGCLQTPTATLNTLVQTASDLGVTLSEAGLQQRLTPAAVRLFQQVVAHSLPLWARPQAWPGTVLQAFSHVYLLDSTEIRLPACLASVFPGKPHAALKVQLSFDYLSGTFQALELTPGRQPDQTCRLHLAHATPDSLHVFDLGYFDQQVLADLAQADAFFISRLQSQVSLFETATASQPLDLLPWLRTLTTASHEQTVWLGAAARLAVRLVVVRLPEAVVAERRRKAHAQAKRWGKTCSQRQIDLLAWACFVTNVAAQTLSGEAIAKIYGVRWQIEIVFKVCKSYAGLDDVRAWRVERLLCQIYARLLGVMVFKGLIADWPLTSARELSLVKAFKVWTRAVDSLAHGLRENVDCFVALVRRLMGEIERFGLKSQRKTSPSTLHSLLQSGLA